MHEPRFIPAGSRQPGSTQSTAPPRQNQWEFAHALLFSGHMIDQPGRSEPRFPSSSETHARKAICEAIAAIAWLHPGATVALAGGASGGDLLFHECCEEQGVPSRVLLALPPDEYEAASVAPAGPAWVQRFRALIKRSAPNRLHVLTSRDGLLEGETDNIWQRTNLWMIEQATACAHERALLALWDGKSGDGPGGTEHFLHAASQSGIRILPIIPIQDLSQF